MAQSLRGERFKNSRIDWDFALEIAYGNFRNCHSERSEESLIVAGGQTKTIFRDVSLRST
jgi:hypothetical protein